MSCLMEQLSRGSPAMTKECGEVLMQIHYFLARYVPMHYAVCWTYQIYVYGFSQGGDAGRALVPSL